MIRSFADLLRWDGTVGRGPYALVGVIGFAIKHNIDRWIAFGVFHRNWGVFNYVIPLDRALQPHMLSREDQVFLATMVAMALPFIWVGLAMTLRRLRSIGLPAWFVIFFFAPVANLAFFLLLAILPERRDTAPEGAPTWLQRFIPDHPAGSAAMAVFITTLVGLAVTGLSVSAFTRYGWGLFVALPFGVGFLSVLLLGCHRPRTLSASLGVALIAVLLLGVALLALAFEGVICLAMAAPLGIALALLGGGVAYCIQRRPTDDRRTTTMFLGVLLGLPGIVGVEQVTDPAAPLFAVKTAVEIAAPPETVWHHVVSFSRLPEPTEWLFRAGIAYPIYATIDGTGVGAQRHCVFSTGEFVEPIEIWDAPRHLKFSVTNTPPPMREWTPYQHLHPPHLENFLVSEGGQFRLEPLPGGRTRLEGTTWYRHNMWPASYWRWWSDFIIHRIHLRVLKHIDRLSLEKS